MEETIFKAFVIFMVAGRSVLTTYWHEGRYSIRHRQGSIKKVFPPELPCLALLTIPKVFENLTVCNEACRKTEMNSLMDFYSKTNGKHWRKGNNWNNTNISHCQWRGILCHFESGHVISIELKMNRLRGNITPQLKNIQYLLAICLQKNRIKNRFEDFVGIMSIHALRICISFNDINGSLPRNISKLVPRLEKLQLTGNSELSGHIPEDIGRLRYLQVLSIGETKISGWVPKSIGMLTRLWFLDFEGLGLQGELSYFRNLSNIVSLHLSSNNLHGQIPKDIGTFYPRIKGLLIQSNGLHGTLPESIGLLRTLKTLNVAGNHLSGLVPSSIGKLNLAILILSHNNFLGFARNYLQNSTRLSIFLAAHNKNLRCNINTIVEALVPAKETLRQLDVSNCKIDGGIPQLIFGYRRLSHLTLASNRLSHTLPITYENMPYLNKMDISHNNLRGAIPRSYSRLLMLLKLDLRGNPKIMGKIASSYLKIDPSLVRKEDDSYSCFLIRFTHNNGEVNVDPSYYNKKYCFCNEHFYGIGGTCHHCMAHARCPSVNSSIIVNNTSARSLSTPMLIKKGFSPFPLPTNVSKLVQCPTVYLYNNICIPGRECACTVVSNPISNNKNGKTKMLQCDKACLCKTGHKGRFCSQCIKSYYREGIRCIKCPEGSNKHEQLGIFLGSVAITIFISIIVFRLSKTKRKYAMFIAFLETVVISILVALKIVPAFLVQAVVVLAILLFNQQQSNCKGIFKTAVFYAQTMDTIVSTTDIWPISVYRAQTYLGSAFNLHFSSLACLFPQMFTLVFKHLALFTMPILATGIIWSAYGIWLLTATNISERPRQSFKYKCIHYCLFFTDLAYFPIVKAVLSVIVTCRSINGVSFMRNYPWINCSGHLHSTLLMMSYFALVVFVFGLPFLLYTPLLYKHRNKLNDKDSTVHLWLGTLYLAYKPKYRAYMEIVLIIRRLVIALLLTVMQERAQLQTILIATTLIICIVFQALAKPFALLQKTHRSSQEFNLKSKNDNGLENSLELFMLCIVLLSFISTRISTPNSPLQYTSCIFVVTIIANCLLILAFCGSLLYRLITKLWGNSNKSTNRQPFLSFIEEDMSASFGFEGYE
eukprot:gene20528-22547_t